MPGGHHPDGLDVHSGAWILIRAWGSSLQEPVGLQNRPRSPSVPHPHFADLDRLAHQLAGTAGYEVVGVQIQAHRIPLTLVVQLRKGDGGDVDLDDCAAFSGAIGDALETAELFPEPYVLEISSPGVDEELRDDRDFRSFRGFPVEVRVRSSDGQDSLRQGLLLERDDAAVHLNIRGRISRIPRADVLSVRLIAPQG